MRTRARWAAILLLAAAAVAAAGETAALRLIGAHALGPGGRPLTAADVMPALEFAYIHWKLGLTKGARSAIGHDLPPLD